MTAAPPVALPIGHLGGCKYPNCITNWAFGKNEHDPPRYGRSTMGFGRILTDFRCSKRAYFQDEEDEEGLFPRRRGKRHRDPRRMGRVVLNLAENSRG